jgi:hypothetical protein
MRRSPSDRPLARRIVALKGDEEKGGVRLVEAAGRVAEVLGGPTRQLAR